MAPNRFATLLHRNTNRFVVVLVYTVLEWILIAFLLLNSVFSYFITRYASFFGLPPPCIWCSRLERLLDGQTPGGFYRSLVCDGHAGEISKLGYCSDHARLAEACGMCQGCSSSRPMRNGVERNITLISLPGNGEIDEGGEEIKCSCCGATMDDGLYSPYLLIKPSWDVLDYKSMTNWIADKEGGRDYRDVDYKDLQTGHMSVSRVEENQEEFITGKIDSLEKEEVEIIQSAQANMEDLLLLSVEGGSVVKSCYNDDVPVQSASEAHKSLPAPAELSDSIMMEDRCPSRQEADDISDDGCLEDQLQVREPEVDKEIQDSVAETYTVEGRDGDDTIETSHVCENQLKVPKNDLVEERDGSMDLCHSVSDNESYMEESDEESEMHAVEEERVPGMTTPLGSILPSNKVLIFDKKECFGPESLDGSILNSVEGDEVLTLDRLKSALETEQKASNALYAELEKERNASAIAANQTMAMITRLQEEKSAMQMEALQYQRMMEEQSEYDQEALQLLNELMMKREREKQELEKELELYRKKVLHYEAKERMRKQVASGRSRTSSASCSADDSDEISLDLNEGDENYLGSQDCSQNTPAGEVPIVALAGENGRPSTGLGESFAEFEEERLAILEQLKALEDKLFALSDEEEERCEDVIPIKLLEDNTALLSGNAECFTPGNQDGVSNRFLYESIDETQNEIDVRRLIGSKAKRLLPLFDAAEMEDDGEGIFEEQVPSIVSHASSSKLVFSEKKLAIEEEVDHVYERLHALEGDREFLKHSINSLKKGDKGMELLQEILQHLRDLRTVELRARNTADDPM